jgi:hypothetical protein
VDFKPFLVPIKCPKVAAMIPAWTENNNTSVSCGSEIIAPARGVYPKAIVYAINAKGDAIANDR